MLSWMDICKIIYKVLDFFFFLSSRCTTYRRRHGFRIVCWLDGVIQQVDKENKEQKQETKRENE